MFHRFPEKMIEEGLQCPHRVMVADWHWEISRCRQGRTRTVGRSITVGAGFIVCCCFFIKSFQLLCTGSTTLLLHSPLLLFTPPTGTLYRSRDLSWWLLPPLPPCLILILTLLLGMQGVEGGGVSHQAFAPACCCAWAPLGFWGARMGPETGDWFEGRSCWQKAGFLTFTNTTTTS